MINTTQRFSCVLNPEKDSLYINADEDREFAAVVGITARTNAGFETLEVVLSPEDALALARNLTEAVARLGDERPGCEGADVD